jgi:hypothetical protein
MKKPREVLAETICPACDGTGFSKVQQSTQPGRKNLSCEVQGMSRQRPNKKATRASNNMSWDHCEVAVNTG